MKEIVLKRMELENFKCFRHEVFDFNSTLTAFAGPNGSGKTTLYDAHSWLLTGKDSLGSEAFKIQPIDEEGNTIPKVETVVREVLSIDGEDVTLEKVYTQKWVKPRGRDYEEMKGHDCVYKVNGVPMTMTEYYSFITNSIGKSDDIRMMSNIYTFFTLNTNERRRKLMEMAGEMPDILTESAYPHLYREFQKAKSVDGVKKTAQFAIKNLKEQLDAIPARKSENERNMPSEDIDFEEIESIKKTLEKELAQVESYLEKSKGAVDDLTAQYNEIMKSLKEAEKSVSDIDLEITKEHNAILKEHLSKKNEVEMQIATLEKQISMLSASLVDLRRNEEQFRNKLQEERAKYRAEMEEKMEDVDKVCPLCKRPFTEEEIVKSRETLEESFNKGKAAKLAVIQKNGEIYKEMANNANADAIKCEEDINASKAEIEKLNAKKADLEEKEKSLPTLEDLMNCNKKYASAVMFRDTVKKKLETFSLDTEEDNPALIEKKKLLKEQIAECISRLAMRDVIARVIARRDELDREGIELASKIAEQDQILFEIREYTKAHINAVESKVSSMFSLVKFQMYEHNLTNDGEREICECLVDGVPYSTNVNTASKINAGVDVVNALTKSLGVSLPLFVDNKESVISLIPTGNQLITLQVEDNNKLTKLF